MKRIHIHIKVEDLKKNIHFYEQLFHAAPSVVKIDYAKWILENPKVNFSLSTGNQTAGIEHLGIQVDTAEELQDVYKDIKKAKGTIKEEGKTTCCYAQSEKSWVTDPQGVSWEVFHTFGESNTYRAPESSCCSDQCC